NDVCYLLIDCNPRQSIPFWKEMGFKLIREEPGYQAVAYQLLPKSYDLPDDGPPASVSIAFYPERVRWQVDAPKLAEHRPRAIRDGKLVKLSDRIIGGFRWLSEGQPVIRIEV